jgi:hypothetical protein
MESQIDLDRAGIEQAVRDYFEGWYTGDADRMARALHPDLAKRAFAQDRDRTQSVDHTTAAEMIEATRAGVGRTRAPETTKPPDIAILGVSSGMASVQAASGPYVEYLHLVKTADGWRILNALWRWADGHRPRA